jgi:DNA adenine methylase
MNERLILFRWFGGKGLLFKKILPYLTTPHQIYVEVYGGGASVLLNKPPSPIEVLNDIDSEVVNIFRVVQDEVKFRELKHRLEWTLYSRAEFVKALEILQNGTITDPVLRAWAFFVAQNQGFAGKNSRDFSEGDWGRSFIRNQADAFASKVESLEIVRNRLRNVLVDNIDSIACIRYWDSPDTLFYLDPPYIHDTRKTKEAYHHEADNEHHRQLVDTLLSIKGQVVLSGYAHEIYEFLLKNGWHKVEIDTVCRAAGKIRGSKLRGEGALKQHAKRVEVLYLKLRNETLF